MSYRARLPQIEAAARLLAISWAFSWQIWILLDASIRSYAFAGVDLVLACAFFTMSRGRWFPVPLFLIHAGLVIYHLYTVLIGASIFWVSMFMNRAFEIALFYVIACAGYRLFAQRRQVARIPTGPSPKDW